VGELITDGRSKRAELQRESRRAHILATAQRVFANKGYHQTRISDIIDAAGIARGTFYLYFESKNAIFLELLDELLARLQQTIVGVDTGPGAKPIKQQLVDGIAKIVRTVEEHRAIAAIIMREAVGLDDDVDRRLGEFYAKLEAWTRESLESGQRMGIVRDIDPDVVACCIIGQVKYLLERRVMRPDGDADAEHIGHAVLDYNLRGVLV
jgi:AcrR family transcriptional regulator